MKFLIEVSDDCETVLIGSGFGSDARKYQIAGDDAPTVALWLPSSQVQIRPSRSKEFPVRIYNPDRDETVKAVPVDSSSGQARA